MEKKGRRSFLEIATAFIGGVLSLAAGIPLIGFAISPAFKKGESKWVDLGLADRLRNSRFKRWTIPSQQKMDGSKQRKNVLST